MMPFQQQTNLCSFSSRGEKTKEEKQGKEGGEKRGREVQGWAVTVLNLYIVNVRVQLRRVRPADFVTSHQETQQYSKSRGQRNRQSARELLSGETGSVLVILITLLAVILAIIFVWKRRPDVKAGEPWTCSQFRCREERFPSSLCSCAADCEQKGDCCTNYYSVCEGQCGTSTQYMRPAYPTKTFPNHYTIVTGLYPESHGIVDNKMYDVNRNASFSLKNEEKFNPSWYQGEPVFDALVRVDRIVGMVMDGLKQQKLHKCVNLVLLSDHGMEVASCEKAAYVSSYQTNTEDLLVIQGAAARIRPKRLPEDFFTFQYEELVKNLSCRAVDQPMKPYLTEHLPKRLHFANNMRIERAHLYMKPGWQAALNQKDVKYCAGGFHGSDNTFTNMQTIFIGYGPGIKSKTTVAPFENIEVYNLLCDLLDIPPVPNNGTHGSLNHLLRNPPYHPVHPPEISLASVCSSAALNLKDLGCSCALLNESQVENLNRRLIGAGIPGGQIPSSAIRSSTGSSGGSALLHAAAFLLHQCIQQGHLYATLGGLQSRATDFSSAEESDSLISSNMVPMFPIFKGIWEYFHNVLLVNYSRNWNGVNVISGPIFDKNADGKYDVTKLDATDASPAPLPTHFFVILLSCKNSSRSRRRCDGPMKTVSFILPHRPDNTETCHDGSDYSWVQDWCQLHVARIRDIELLSGLSFYPELLPVEESLQLKTFLKTF
ncbi:Ectonucleotide pyrophosphatase/phosphodiesterase family member 3 [Bagarius yarrelli]|uniref:Ectonucleotide pyrophosphatase/phosphodiesterase family member 3 n=1 Tax=Bagarius yarrelli TaxID=175774 RepID=A0A556TZP5_BAGYA|nr:Ectonucleotide pyrophosphatase/phosphodiesterase family member 3 [Bagarius yarrelli]